MKVGKEEHKMYSSLCKAKMAKVMWKRNCWGQVKYKQGELMQRKQVDD